MTEQTNEQVSGIFVDEHQVSNMKIQRIVVSNPAILKILELVRLPIADQEDAVDKLVDRTPEWKDLETDDQIARIKAVLTQETVLYYLQCIETVRSSVDFCEVGIDVEGSVVVYAYYTTNRGQRRELKSRLSDEDIKEIIEETNLFGGEKIVDLAQRKLEKLRAKTKEKEGKQNG